MTTSLLVNHLALTRNERTLYQDIHFEAHAGHVIGILGPNGCGKTTLLHALIGLHPIKQGEIYLNQDNIKALSRKNIARRAGLLFQEFNTTFPLTVWEYCLSARFPYINYFKKESSQDYLIVKTALKQMELTALQHNLIQQLSGGEKRRLAIASILAQTPQIFLLDEPTNHLDIHQQIKTMQLLTEKKEAIILVALHDVNLAQQFCNHILLLFGNGQSVFGKTSDMLTAEHLTQLYQHPMISIKSRDRIFWSPA